MEESLPTVTIEMCENMSINFITTAAESPWSNGLVEKHNGIIGEAVYKVMEDIQCSVEVALCWAINAKNSLQNVYGFSPYQLVFGHNPNLPSAFEDKLPALEGVTSSKLIAAHLNSMHKAREEFIKMEASEKIRRAMRAKTRTHANVKYFNGDEVFYKRDDSSRWKGPGRVIGQDGTKVLIKIPTGLISVHTCRTVLTSDTEQNRLKHSHEHVNHPHAPNVSNATTENTTNKLDDDDDDDEHHSRNLDDEDEVEDPGNVEDHRVPREMQD